MKKLISRCKKHKLYKGVGKPTGDCQKCRDVWLEAEIERIHARPLGE